MNPGIYSDIPMQAYLADALTPEPALSASIALKLVTQSALHAYHAHPRLGGAPPDLSEKADIGSVAHDLLLGGEKKIAVINPADHRSKPTKDNPLGNVPIGWTNDAIRAARDTARTDGLTPILLDDMSEVRLMESAAREFIASCADMKLAFSGGLPELTIIWREGERWCKARPDWYNADQGMCVHYKTTLTSVAPESFIRGVMRTMSYGFAVQWYARGLKALGLGNFSLILAQEQSRPFACSSIGLAPSKAAYEDARVDRAIKYWDFCHRLGAWPGYDSRVHYAEATAYELADAEAGL